MTKRLVALVLVFLPMAMIASDGRASAAAAARITVIAEGGDGEASMQAFTCSADAKADEIAPQKTSHKTSETRIVTGTVCLSGRGDLDQESIGKR